MSEPLFIAYATHDYRSEMVELVRTMDEHGLEHVTHVGWECRGAWQANVRSKPSFILSLRQAHARRPLVYLDADARVLQRPELFWRLDCDFAATVRERRNKELMSGTLYFAPTDEATRFLLEWEHECRLSDRWDSVSLRAVFDRRPPESFTPLPASYCSIFDAVDMNSEPPVIQHTQASRRMRRVVGAA